MSVLCNYELVLPESTPDAQVKQIRQELVDDNETFEQFFNACDDENQRSFGTYGVAWRTDEKDMARISAKYADVLFTWHILCLEDNDDETYWYFLGGKRQVAPVRKIHSAFNESELEEV